MEQHYFDDDHDGLEAFLQESADDLRMQPSDAVWKGINRKLAQRRRRVGMLTGSLLVIAALLGYYTLPGAKKTTLAEVSRPSQPSPTPATASRNTNDQPSSTALPTNPLRIASRQHTPVTPLLVPPAMSIVATAEVPEASVVTTEESIFSKTGIETASTTLSEDNSLTVLDPTAKDKRKAVFTNTVSPNPTARIALTIGDDDANLLGANGNAQTKTAASPDESSVDLNKAPYTIESLTNVYKGSPKRRLSWQVIFTPTISYRRLSENKTYLRSVQAVGVAPGLPAQFDAEEAVTHKPHMGMEAGLVAKYRVTPALQLTAGAQINISRYGMKAYQGTIQMATLALNNEDNGVDFVSARSRYRNLGTTGQANWLDNLYVQASLPVGMEVKVLRGKKTSFGVGATVQPTYIISKEAYVLSADYKNYAEVPSLVRRFNMGTAVNAHVDYSTGRLDWQVGPQVRYQLMSSFVKEYPVKENLVDFGFRIGVSMHR